MSAPLYPGPNGVPLPFPPLTADEIDTLADALGGLDANQRDQLARAFIIAVRNYLYDVIERVELQASAGPSAERRAVLRKIAKRGLLAIEGDRSDAAQHVRVWLNWAMTDALKDLGAEPTLEAVEAIGTLTRQVAERHSRAPDHAPNDLALAGLIARLEEFARDIAAVHGRSLRFAKGNPIDLDPAPFLRAAIKLGASRVAAWAISGGDGSRSASVIDAVRLRANEDIKIPAAKVTRARKMRAAQWQGTGAAK